MEHQNTQHYVELMEGIYRAELPENVTFIEEIHCPPGQVLVSEGIVNDLSVGVNRLRRTSGFHVSDHITLELVAGVETSWAVFYNLDKLAYGTLTTSFILNQVAVKDLDETFTKLEVASARGNKTAVYARIFVTQ